MIEALSDVHVVDGEPVASEHIATALTAGGFVYDDGATQEFDATGTTTYVEHGQQTRGQWYLDDDGNFCSFWPPSYRACYDLRWIVEEDRITGLRFAERGRGSRFDDRYR